MKNDASNNSRDCINEMIGELMIGEPVLTIDTPISRRSQWRPPGVSLIFSDHRGVPSGAHVAVLVAAPGRISQLFTYHFHLSFLPIIFGFSYHSFAYHLLIQSRLYQALI